MTQNCTIEVAGEPVELTLTSDEESGKSVLRRNGRPLARPLGPGDVRRDFSIGHENYAVPSRSPGRARGQIVRRAFARPAEPGRLRCSKGSFLRPEVEPEPAA